MRLLVLFLLTFYSLQADSSCHDSLFTFNISDSDSKVRVSDIVDNLSRECSFSVKIKDKEAKKILNKNLYLVHIKDYTLDNMFDFLFTQNNLFYKYNEKRDVLTISYLQTRTFEIDYVNLSEQTTESVKTITVGSDSGTSSNGIDSGSSSNGNGNTDSTTVTTKSEFKFWSKLSKEIDAILSRDGDKRKIKSKSIINRTAGIVTITGTKDQIERVSRYLDKVKSRIHKQVILETKLIELTYANKQTTGVDWSKLNFSIKGNFGESWTNGVESKATSFAYNFSMDGLVNFLKTYGDVHVLSTPKILTLNNQAAVINVGKQINYRYQSGSLSTVATGQSTSNTYVMNSVFIGLTLNIVPEITDSGFVILRINPVVSRLDDDQKEVTDAQGVRIMPPDIKIKQLSSIVKAKDGSHVVIGGLVSNTKKNIENGVPVLGDIPLFGLLFHSTTEETYRTELIVVITPKIIKHDKFPSIKRVEEILDGTLDE
jgi:general secretion pathway protein D